MDMKCCDTAEITQRIGDPGQDTQEEEGEEEKEGGGRGVREGGASAMSA